MAIDGSKFKAINSRDCNFTNGKIDKRHEQIEESIQRYLSALETADRTQPVELEAKTVRLTDKIARLRQQMRELDSIKEQLKTQPDGQISRTDPHARSMATSARGSGMVAYNVQVAVDAKHHLIVAHEVTNAGSDRAQLGPMAQAAREAMGKKRLRALADRGYFSGHQIKEFRVILCLKPPNGQIKKVLGFMQMSMQGRDKSDDEFKLVCLAQKLRTTGPIQAA